MHAGYCKTWIIPTLGHVRLDRLTAADVNRLMLAMKEAGKADATRRNAYTTLRKSLDDAVLSGLLATNPAHKVSQPRARRQEARYLTTDEAARLLTGQMLTSQSTSSLLKGHFSFYATLTRPPARGGSGLSGALSRLVALISAAHAGRVALIWPARAGIGALLVGNARK